jgi:hypothetical protein
VAALLGHTGHTITNGVTGVLVCLIFFSFCFFEKNDEEEQKKEAKAGDKPCASKRKIQQSAPLASTVSTMEMAKKQQKELLVLLKLPKEPLQLMLQRRNGKCLHCQSMQQCQERYSGRTSSSGTSSFISCS